jgi:hypothetical protein
MEPEVSVFVDPGPVAGKVDIAVLRPVRLAISLIVLEDPAEHRRPGSAEYQVPATAGTDLLAALVVDAGLDSWERLRRGARLDRRYAGERRDHDHARFRLPPGVDDRRLVAPDVLAVPDPGLGIDRLTDRAQQPEL